MSVMPRRETERALPRGEKIKVQEGLELQLATIEGTRKVDVSAGRHGHLVPVRTREPGIMVFQNGNYAGHYTLPEEMSKKELGELCQTKYIEKIIGRYRR